MTSLPRLFWTFVGIGALTLGGGYAMLPLVEREVVRKHGWLEDAVFIDVLAIAQSLPGPVSLNLAVFVGHRTRGFAGAVAAALGLVLPSFVVMLAIVMALARYWQHPGVVRAFNGLRPAVTALIVAALARMAVKAGLRPWGYALVLLVAGALMQPWWPLSPAYLIALAILLALVRPLRRT